MHKEYILLNGFRKAKRGFTAGFHVPLMEFRRLDASTAQTGGNRSVCHKFSFSRLVRRLIDH